MYKEVNGTLTTNHTHTHVCIFVSERCQFCGPVLKVAIPMMKHAPINIVNVDRPEARDIVVESLKTNTGIRHVPFAILFVNGMATATMAFENMAQIGNDIMDLLAAAQQFGQDENKHNKSGSRSQVTYGQSDSGSTYKYHTLYEAYMQ